jgi:hypothetical protein
MLTRTSTTSGFVLTYEILQIDIQGNVAVQRSQQVRDCAHWVESTLRRPVAESWVILVK